MCEGSTQEVTRLVRILRDVTWADIFGPYTELTEYKGSADEVAYPAGEICVCAIPTDLDAFVYLPGQGRGWYLEKHLFEYLED